MRRTTLAVTVILMVTAAWIWHHHRSGHDWRQAQSALARHDLEAAAGHLDQHLESHPEDSAGWLLAARTARRRELFADARRFLEHCQELGGLTDATRLEWDLLRVQQGDTSGIDVRLRTRIGPDHPDALLVLEALARGYIRQERANDALEACALWVAREPNHPWPYLWQGYVYERLAHLDRAEASYRDAVRVAPDDPETRATLGGLLLRLRQPASAAEQFEAVLAGRPDHVEALTGLAACRIEAGRAGEAAILLDRALDRVPGSPRVLFLRGKAALQLDAKAEAVRWSREAVQLSPYDPEAFYQLAQAYRATGAEAEAINTANQADRLRSEISRLDALARQAAATPDDPQVRHEAGMLALRLGRTAEALRWLHGVLALKSDHRETHAVLAEHYRQTGDGERADHHNRLAGDH